MCFSIAWLVQILIWLVVLSVVIALLRIWVLPLLATTDPRIPATINIVIWAMVVIFVIYVVADLLMCAVGGGMGVGLPRSRP
jgi:hypothetical protein